MLPGLSGIEVLESDPRGRQSSKDMPVVVITAWSHAEVERLDRGRGSLRLEAVRPGRAQQRRRGAARMTLARRMWLASAVLAALVGGRLRRR